MRMQCLPLSSSAFDVPAFASSLNVGDKPIGVAEDVDVRIAGVAVGERQRHRDNICSSR